eukprot:29257-Pleurochrysis_carterae.AAC.1
MDGVLEREEREQASARGVQGMQERSLDMQGMISAEALSVERSERSESEERKVDKGEGIALSWPREANLATG